MGLLAKVHSRTDENGKTITVVAVCDKRLINKVLETGDCVLDLKTYASFYSGAEVSEAEAVQLIKSAGNVNIVGKKALAAARKAFEIDEGNVLTIGGEPHLQVYLI
ncbi:MAG: DUF424 domain-containing protein [Candidatus Micrarchaeota archaeon]